MNAMEALRYMPQKDDVLMEVKTGNYAVVKEDNKEKSMNVKLYWSDDRSPPMLTPIAHIRSSLIKEELILARKQ